MSTEALSWQALAGPPWCESGSPTRQERASRPTHCTYHYQKCTSLAWTTSCLISCPSARWTSCCESTQRTIRPTSISLAPAFKEAPDKELAGPRRIGTSAPALAEALYKLYTGSLNSTSTRALAAAPYKSLTEPRNGPSAPAPTGAPYRLPSGMPVLPGEEYLNSPPRPAQAPHPSVFSLHLATRSLATGYCKDNGRLYPAILRNHVITPGPPVDNPYYVANSLGPLTLVACRLPLFGDSCLRRSSTLALNIARRIRTGSSYQPHYVAWLVARFMEAFSLRWADVTVTAPGDGAALDLPPDTGAVGWRPCHFVSADRAYVAPG